MINRGVGDPPILDYLYLMKRRSSIKLSLAVAASWLLGVCVEIYGAASRWSWPGYPREAALRNHLANSPNHPFSSKDLAGKSFEELIDMHETDHRDRRGDKGRWKTPRHVPGTKKNPPLPSDPKPASPEPPPLPPPTPFEPPRQLRPTTPIPPKAIIQPTPPSA